MALRLRGISPAAALAVYSVAVFSVGGVTPALGEQYGADKLTRVDQLGVRTARGELAHIAQSSGTETSKRPGVHNDKSGDLAGGAALPEQSGAASARSPEEQILAPAHVRKDTVDADEIVRVLDRGDATTLNAASAVASGVVNGAKDKPGQDKKAEQVE